MSKRQKKDEAKLESDMIAFRVWPPHAEIIREKAAAGKLSKNKFGRQATLQAAGSGILDLPEKMDNLASSSGVLTEQVIRFGKLLSDVATKGE